MEMRERSAEWGREWGVCSEKDTSHNSTESNRCNRSKNGLMCLRLSSLPDAFTGITSDLDCMK